MTRKAVIALGAVIIVVFALISVVVLLVNTAADRYSEYKSLETKEEKIAESEPLNIVYVRPSNMSQEELIDLRQKINNTAVSATIIE